MRRYIDQSYVLVSLDMNIRQLYHLTDDLHLSDKEYLLCLTILYISYAFFEVCPPSPCGSLSSPKALIVP